MGWAKYAEDNLDIFNNRMYEKGIGWPSIGVAEFRKDIKKSTYTMPIDEEYLLLLEEIKKIQLWINIINESYKLIKTHSIILTLDRQMEQLTRAKDEYINYKYDHKFKPFNDKKYNLGDKEIKAYETRIIKAYIEYFIDKMKLMENHTDSDSIEINDLYRDIEEFINVFLKVNKKNVKISLIQYLRQEILNEKNEYMILCNHCENKTYKDFKFCIECKYPNEVS